MALEGQTVQVPLLKGLNTKVDPKQVPFGEMSLLENVIFKTVLKYQKRNGYTALPKTVLFSPFSYTFSQIPASIDRGVFCTTFKNEKLLGDGFGLYSYSESDDDWEYKGRLETCQTSLKSIYDKINVQIPSTILTINSNENPDSAINNTSGQTLYAWEIYNQPSKYVNSPLGLQYCLIDNDTDQNLFTDLIYTGNNLSRPRCIAIGSLLYVFYVDLTDGKIKARSITSSGASAATDIVTNIDTTNPNYDIFVNNSLIYVAYNGTASTVKIASFNSALVNQASVSKSEIASNGIGIFADTSNNIWCAYNNGTNTKAFIMDSTLVTTVLAPTTVGAATNVQNVTGVYDGNFGVIFYDQPGAYNTNYTPTGITTTANLTQPAVGSTVTVTTSATLEDYVGQIIALSGGGGFYYVTSATSGGVTLLNLGTIFNAAPAATVASGSSFSPSNGCRNNGIILYSTLTVGGTAGSSATFSRQLGLVSRAFLYDGVPHVIGCYESAIQPVFMLCSLYNVNGSVAQLPTAHYAARIAGGVAAGFPTKPTLCSVNNYSSGRFEAALMTKSQIITKTISNNAFSNFFSGVSSVDLNLNPSQVSKKEIGNNLHVASGSLMIYDGLNVVEQGFHIFPESLNLQDTGTGRIADGFYNYVAVYSWIDALGQVHRSAPSPIASITTSGGNSAVAVTAWYLSLTQKNDATIEIYRTTVNGTIFYRIDSNYIGTPSYPFRNQATTGGVVVFTDVFSDDEIVGNPQLYTTGEVENIVSPSPKALSTFKNRLMVVSADDDTTVWYSKQVVPGFPVELSDLFVQNTEQAAGGIVDTVQLDDKEIIFKGENIYYVVGSGPAPSGANNDFTDPTLIATDVGLVDSASIVVMPDGVMFKTQKGIYLLDRSLSVSYVGAKVEDYNQYTVLSAKLIANVNQIRFMLSNGQAIVYDYFVKEWAVFTNHSSVDSMISDELFYYLKSDGTLLKETPGAYSDNGTFISMKARTGWIQFANVQGFQRIWEILLLGEYKSAHTLQVQFEYDSVPTVVQTMSVAPGVLTNYEYSFSPNRQKCTSMRLTIQDVELGGVIGESYTLSNLAFYVGIKKGLNKVPVTQRAT